MAFIYFALFSAMKYKVATNLIPCTLASDSITPIIIIFTHKRWLYSPYETSTVWRSAYKYAY